MQILDLLGIYFDAVVVEVKPFFAYFCLFMLRASDKKID